MLYANLEGFINYYELDEGYDRYRNMLRFGKCVTKYYVSSTIQEQKFDRAFSLG